MSSLTCPMLSTSNDIYEPMVERYIKIRMKQLEEELEKNPSAENYLIFTKAIQELSLVLDLIQRKTEQG